MIFGIGCDIVEHKTTSNLDWPNDPYIQNRLFSELEISLCPEKDAVKYYSGRFAIKEAILKCLGTGMEDGLSLKEIELLRTKSGTISVSLQGNFKILESKLKIKRWHISLTHSRASSVAFVVAEL